MPQRYCLTHKERPAVGQCNLCHKPICEECRYAGPAEGLFCSAECYDKYLAYHSRKQPVVRSSRLKSLVIGCLIVLAIAAVALFVGGRILRWGILKLIYDAIF